MTSGLDIYLVYDLGGAPPDDVSRHFEAVLDVRRVPSVLFTGVPAQGIAIADLIAAVQARGAAALIDGDATLARAVGADGVHIPWSQSPIEAYATARKAVGPDMIAGADAGRSRHDAMELGEAGADYVAFGIPAHVEDRATAKRRQVELISWWSGVIEVPCVAYDIDDAEQARNAAEAGADFIAIRVSARDTTADARAHIEQLWAAASAANAADDTHAVAPEV